MKFNLLEDWRDVLKTAWSIRLIVLAALLSGVEVWFGIFGAPHWMPLGVFAALSAVTSGAAFAARLYAQPIRSKESSNASE